MKSMPRSLKLAWFSQELELHMFNDQHMVVLEGNVLAD